tara:strand:- start:756 stop:929 length:174 start_codon:yes stop_codon:yes gene_type:complete
MKNIEFTLEEANALIQIIDIAQRVKGLEVSKNCIHFVEKLQEAFKEEVKKEELVEAD